MNDLLVIKKDGTIFYVKKEFEKECTDYENRDLLELLQTFRMGTFLHNPDGYALVYADDQGGEHWIDGNRISTDRKTPK
jgi:hypothetical protein